MEPYKRYVPIDYAKFAPDLSEAELEARYGLPAHVQFCRECVMSNQKPNSCYEFEHTINSVKKSMHIGEDGVCDACHACRNKVGRIDWEDRERRLRELCDRYRKTDGSYDCLVPGSGGKDSFYAAHMLKYKYGMHPLTVTWAPHMYTPWGWENFQAWIHAGFDNYLCTPNGMTHRLLTRLATENLFHPFQAFILGQKQLAPKMAAKFGIPLVFYGENEAEFGNPIADNESALRDEHFFATNSRDNIYLGGVSLRQLEEDFKVDPADLAIYLPSDTSDIEKNHIQVHYLGYYLKWHPQGAYYYSVEHGGFKPSPERTQGTYSKYNSIDDKIDDFFYYTTYIKYGIGRTSYDAAQEIRNEEITREEGVALCKRYDGEFPTRFEQEIWDYLSLDERHFPHASRLFEQPAMDREYFMHLADRFRSPHIWMYRNGRWSYAISPLRGIPNAITACLPKNVKGGSGMAKKIRLIARLDVKNDHLVKGIQLEGLRKLGDPHDFAADYYRQGVDELLYMDIVASLYNRNNLSAIVRRTTDDVFIPITVGGGLRSVDDVRSILQMGADKAAINTAAIKDESIITQVAEAFGIEAKKRRDGPGYEAYYDNGREHSGKDVIEWARRGVALGAGEILLTSVDKEGFERGMDCPLIRELCAAVSVPVIVSGGCGGPGDAAAAAQAGASAVAVASILHYKKTTVPQLKAGIREHGIEVR